MRQVAPKILACPKLLTPFLQLEQRDVAASQTLRAALCKAEASHPGFSYDLVLGLVRKSGDTGIPVNMNESLLRLQGAVSDQDSKHLPYLVCQVVMTTMYYVLD